MFNLLSTTPQFLTQKLEKILQVKRLLGDLIISPCDKNTNVLVAQCPVLKFNALVKLYCTPRHYTAKPSDNITDIVDKHLSKFKTWANKSLKSLALPRTLNRSALPNCYGLPKFKDLNKERPICSYFKHPAKRVFNVCARALTLLMKLSPISGFNLSSINDVTNYFTTIRNQLPRFRHHHKILSTFSFDIKEMYTNIPHALIIHCINLLLSWGKMQGVLGITIPKNTPKSDKNYFALGNKVRMDPNRIFVPFATIFEAVTFDLNNCVSVLGNTLITSLPKSQVSQWADRCHASLPAS